MTTTEQQQDHPGDDWVEIIGREGYHTRFFHPGLHHVVIWKEDKDGASRAAAVAECRAISASALAYEKMKTRAQERGRLDFQRDQGIARRAVTGQ